MERWPSEKAEVRGSPVKVVEKQWQEERWCQSQVRPGRVDIMVRTKASRWARSTATCFSRRRMDLRSAVESGIRQTRRRL